MTTARTPPPPCASRSPRRWATKASGWGCWGIPPELAAYQRVIDDYGQDPAPALREQVATALGNKGVRLGVLGRSDDELAAYQRVIDDYGQDPAPALREPSPGAGQQRRPVGGAGGVRTTS